MKSAFKIKRITVIGTSTTYKKPDSILNYIYDPNAEEAFVILEREGEVKLEFVSDLREEYAVFKLDEEVLAIPK